MGDLLKIQKYVMMLTNKRKVHSRSVLVNKLHKVYSKVIECYFVIFTQSLLVNAVMKWKCTHVFFDLCCYYLNHTNATIMHLLFKKSAMKKSLEYITDYEQTGYNQEEETSKMIYDYYSRLNFKIGKYVMVMASVIPSAIWYILSMFHARTGGSEQCPLTNGIMYQVWYPFDTSYNWLPILCDLIMCYLAIMMHISNRTCPVTLVIFELAQIKILTNKIRNIDANAEEIRRIYDVSYEKALNIAINSCIKRHQDIISLMGLLQEATKEMMLIGFFSNSIELAGFIIQIFTATSNYHFVRSFLLFPVDILQMLVFFWFANEVYTESTALADVIYNEIKWVTYTNPLRKKLVIMIMRAQRPLYFVGTGIGEITLEKYKRILKSCFSAVTFLKTVYEI
nr:odorant receptor [Semanotus bifasciatus]